MRRAALLSAGVHALIALLFLLPWLRPVAAPDQGAAEMQVIFVDPGGAPAAAPPVPPAPPTPDDAAKTPEKPVAEEPDAEKPADQKSSEQKEPAPAVQAETEAEPVPPPPAAPQLAEPVEDAKAPEPSKKASPPPAVRLGANDSAGETDEIVTDMPVSPDPSAPNRLPRYPAEAARLGQQGMVILRLVVTTDGHVAAVGIQSSSGFPSLDRAARDAAASWRFKPRGAEGTAIPSTTLIRLRFVLD